MANSSSRRTFLSGPLTSDAVILGVMLVLGACLFTGFLLWFNSMGAAGASQPSGESNPPGLPFLGQAQPSMTASLDASPTSRTGAHGRGAAGAAFASVTPRATGQPPKFTEIVPATFTRMASLTPMPVVLQPGSTPQGNPRVPAATHTPKHSNPPIHLTATRLVSRPPVHPCAQIPKGGLAPSDDTWIDSADPANGHASQKNLYAQKSNGVLRRSLLKFNLSAVSSVSNATLYLHVQQPSSVSISIFQLQADWNESTATWNAGLSGPWSQPGGDYQANAIAHFTPKTSCNVAVNLTSLAQAWAGSPSSNFGIILIVTGPAGPQAVFASKERSAYAPSLIITP